MPCSVQVLPPPPSQTPTSLSLTCPVAVTVKGSFDVTGSLSPAFAGAPITITYTNPNGSIVHATTTDLNGNFADSAQATASGTWSVSATFAGDTTFSASSASCVGKVS
jgi:hypothetical protein